MISTPGFCSVTAPASAVALARLASGSRRSPDARTRSAGSNSPRSAVEIKQWSVTDTSVSFTRRCNTIADTPWSSPSDPKKLTSASGGGASSRSPAARHPRGTGRQKAFAIDASLIKADAKRRRDRTREGLPLQRPAGRSKNIWLCSTMRPSAPRPMWCPSSSRGRSGGASAGGGKAFLRLSTPT